MNIQKNSASYDIDTTIVISQRAAAYLVAELSQAIANSEAGEDVRVVLSTWAPEYDGGSRTATIGAYARNHRLPSFGVEGVVYDQSVTDVAS